MISVLLLIFALVSDFRMFAEVQHLQSLLCGISDPSNYDASTFTGNVFCDWNRGDLNYHTSSSDDLVWYSFLMFTLSSSVIEKISSRKFALFSLELFTDLFACSIQVMNAWLKVSEFNRL